MTRLRAMTDKTYKVWLDAAIEHYAQDKVDAGNWPARTALAQSRQEFTVLLPQGLATEHSYLYEILDEPGLEAVGFLWFVTRAEGDGRSAFVYDVEVKPEQRRKGHAAAAFREMERIARDMKLTSIGLHVFGHNTGAQTLYRALGYEITNINMRKML